MKIKESIGREIIALIVTVMAVMFFVSLLMIKRIEYTYQNYVYDTKTDSLNSSIHSVESELEKIENTTYRILTDSDVQREISLWLEAEERLQELEDKPGTSKERLENQKQKADSMRQLIQKVDPVITADQSLVTGFFIAPDGHRYNGYGGSALQIPLRLQDEIERRAKEQAGDLVYLVCWQKNGVLQIGYPGQREENAQTRLVLARTMREKKSLTLAHGGTLILVLDPARLSNSYTTASHKLLIEDPEQGVIFTTLLQAEEQDFLAWESNPEKIKDSRYQILFLNNEKYFVTKLVSSDQHWDYYSISSYEELFGLLDKADMIYIVLFVGMTVLLCGAAVHFSMYLVHPIVELSGKMRSIRNSSQIPHDLRAVLPAEGELRPRQDEIGELQKQFYEMVKELDQLIHENYEQKIYLQQAQLSALRTQLNPHFLYNTLDLIRWLATSQRSNQIPGVVRALGDILRLTMNSKQNKITIGEEVDYLRGYLSIQKIRFGDRLNMRMEIPEELMEYSIPAFSLQPLVENSVNYAMEQMIQPCFITVSIQDQGENLMCTVTDNGPGMEAGILEKLKDGSRKPKGNGIGLCNLDDRLKSLYGPEYGILIEKAEGGGTKIRFWVRKERQQQE